jgi:hypothetical protein
MAQNDEDQLKSTKAVMGALVRMPPKPHEDMKLGKPRAKSKKSPAKRKAKQPK